MMQKNTCEALDSALLCRIFNEKVKKLEGRKEGILFTRF